MRRALGLTLLLGACALPPPPLSYDDRGVEELEPIQHERIEPGVMRVRLAAFESVQRLTLRKDDGSELVLRREGNQVRSSSGELKPDFQVRAETERAVLQLRDRDYYGEIHVAAHPAGGLYVENRVDLEDYIAGVVPAELVLWSAKESEIEAQAIAARTYALRSLAKRRLGQAAFLWDDTRDQVYLGRFRSGDSRGARRVAQRLNTALERSRGLVLRDSDGEYYDVRFHASCGGMTTSPAEAFPLESVWHHAPVACEPCRVIGAEEALWPAEDERRRLVHWRFTAPPAELSRLAVESGLNGPLRSFAAPQLDRDQRWQSVELRSSSHRVRISLEDLRRILGAGELKSGRLIKVWPPVGQAIAGGVYFEGLGRGHGAGLCQVGSHAYAEQGWTAERILHHYLPGSRITPLGRDFLAASRP